MADPSRRDHDPKSVRKERMVENARSFDFRLADDGIAKLATMETGASLFVDHRDPEAAVGLGSRFVD